jgi:hypothetical protein
MVNPATLRYVRDVALPYATDHGIELHELRKVRRDGTVETLHGRLVQPGSRSLPIPVRTPDTAAPGTRSSKATTGTSRSPRRSGRASKTRGDSLRPDRMPSHVPYGHSRG